MISCDLEGVSKSEQNEDNDEEKVGKVDDRPAPTPVLRLFLFFRLLMAHFHFVSAVWSYLQTRQDLIYFYLLIPYPNLGKKRLEVEEERKRSRLCFILFWIVLASADCFSLDWPFY